MKQSTNFWALPPMTARTLSLSALLLAADVVLYKISVGPSFFQVSFGFLTMALMGYLYGPVWAGLLEVLSNTLNYTLLGSGTFHPAFLIAAFLGGFINGYFLYKREVSWWRILVAQLLIMFVLSLLLNSWLISVVYQSDFVTLFKGRFLRNVVLIPFQTVLIYIFFTSLIKRKIFTNLPHEK